MTRPPSGPSVGAAAGAPARRPGDSGPAGPFREPGRPGGLRIAGIPVTLTPGAALLGVLAAGFSAFTLPALDPGRSVAGYLAAAAGVVAVLLASMVVHELAHSISARHYGFSVPVTVGFFGGLRHGRAPRQPGVRQPGRGPGSSWELELPSARALGRVAATGPLASLLLGLCSGAAVIALSGSGAGPLPVAVAAAAAWINGLLAVANLVPGAGLDGGRIVRALAWARSATPPVQGSSRPVSARSAERS